ncbi:MAG: PKD domain-containing protein [Chthoniobacteraceae bacterium]|nr:PKD domain-containing protein [Chthoniobacteraceae bacterium]
MIHPRLLGCLLGCALASMACAGEEAATLPAVPLQMAPVPVARTSPGSVPSPAASASPLPNPPSSGRTMEVPYLFGWVTDPEGNLWTFLRARENALSRWNGREWTVFPCPKPRAGFYELAADRKGRIWMIASVRQQTPMILNPRENRWETFASAHAAYEAHLADPPRFFGRHPGFEAPDYSADHKRIAFKTRAGEVHFFDGSAWHVWLPAEIVGKAGNFPTRQPFFDAEDRLSITADNEGWQWDAQTGWKKAAIVDRYAPPPPRVLSELVPEGGVTQSPDSLAIDNRDAAWLTWQHRLYKARFGLCVPVFSEQETDPFANGRKITKAWTDNFGRAFLQTDPGTLLMVAPRGKPPHTTLEIKKTAVDGVDVTMRATGKAGTDVRYQWRLDDQPWVSSTTGAVSFRTLSGGTHRLTAIAVDAELQEDPAPPTATFEVKIDAEKQVAGLIRQLADPDYGKRKEAIDALARQPERAVRALKAAREKAGDDARWWMDAALQQIERERAARVKP